MSQPIKESNTIFFSLINICAGQGQDFRTFMIAGINSSPQDNVAAITQTICSDTFSWMKSLYFN